MALNVQNLKIPTSEEARENGRKGGISNGQTMKNRRTMQEAMRAMLELSVSKKEASKGLEGYEEFISDNPTLMDILNLVQIREAREGNTKSYELVRDTAGFKPVDQVQTDINIMSDSDKALLEKVAKRTGIDTKKD